MTAFASRTGSHATQAWAWEMRGVNGRGLDLRLRLPEGVPGLEAGLRAALTARLTRGNVTVGLRLTRDEAATALVLDQAQLDRVLAALDQVQERAFAMGVTLGQPTAADVLGQRGVIVQGQSPAEGSDEGLPEALLADFEILLNDFAAMRASEGAALHGVIAAQLDSIEGLIEEASAAAEARRPEVRASLSAALRRIVTDVTEVEEGRIAQELALLAVKSDITEELDRLRAHIAAARVLLATDGPQGRKLDFLTQEFNREANTVCSKSGSAPLTRIGLDLKAAIDQMREQIQNVE